MTDRPASGPWQNRTAQAFRIRSSFCANMAWTNWLTANGVHFYPSNPDPNTPLAQRIDGLKERAFALCSSAKPCWLTEWGFANRDLRCPIHDETRVKLFQTEREAFKTFIREGRLAAIIYYNRTALHGYESQAIFRCGALTDAGKLALEPM
jgi:hypothetical protein